MIGPKIKTTLWERNTHNAGSSSLAIVNGANLASNNSQWCTIVTIMHLQSIYEIPNWICTRWLPTSLLVLLQPTTITVLLGSLLNVTNLSNIYVVNCICCFYDWLVSLSLFPSCLCVVTCSRILFALRLNIIPFHICVTTCSFTHTF